MRQIRPRNPVPTVRALAVTILLPLLAGLPATSGATVQAPSHERWTQLLAACVITIDDGASTAVDYGCFDRRHAELQDYLDALSSLSTADFEALSRAERLALLINAYNAWTVELILTAWPELESIRDLGSLFRSPWKKHFIPFLGDTLSLDDIEHGMIRQPGRYDDPRIHFAVNCASVGCPALRKEAFTGVELDKQLEEQTRRFLGDRSRNRVRDDVLELSPLFDWYGDDFRRGWRDTEGLEGFLLRYADALGLSPSQQQALEIGAMELRFLDYDWSLNASR